MSRYIRCVARFACGWGWNNPSGGVIKVLTKCDKVSSFKSMIMHFDYAPVDGFLVMTSHLFSLCNRSKYGVIVRKNETGLFTGLIEKTKF
jgi:hypothetical protein